MPGWPACVLDTGRFPKDEPGIPDGVLVFFGATSHVIQLNFSRTTMISFRLMPVAKIQIKLGQCCQDDGWILFILSNGGSAGWAGTRVRQKGAGHTSVLLLNPSGCQLLREARWPMRSWRGWGASTDTKNLIASDVPEGGMFIPPPPSPFLPEGSTHCLKILV